MDVTGGLDMGMTFHRDIASGEGEEAEAEAEARAARAGKHRAVAEAPVKGYVNDIAYGEEFDAVVRLAIRAAEQAEAAAVAAQEREDEDMDASGFEGDE